MSTSWYKYSGCFKEVFMSVPVSVILICVLCLAYIVNTYNRLVRMKQEIDESYAAIDTELKRRFDLIPNLVEIVKGYASHEKGTLESVIQARNKLVKSSDVESNLNNQNSLTQALGKLIMVTEAYPDLKANENFHDLMGQLNDTETKIAQSRRFYNAIVRDYNTAIKSFPQVLIASGMGFNPKPYFGIENHEAFEPAKISFSHDSQTIDAQVKIQDKTDI